MDETTAISIQNLGKKYRIGQKKDGSLRGTIQNIFKSSQEQDEFWALKDVSFDVKKGDVVGIIGKNGAGKSTLLKLLSQITKPTEGSIEINGRIASLLEVGTGFHPELTGRENVFLNGTILGMSRKEVAAKFDEIVSFSGVEKFIDTPVKHYSSGMYVRLAFAVAAHLEPDILVIDEVLAVGDAEFQKKCLGKMKDVALHGRTVIFVSHDMGAISELCTNSVYLNKGRIEKIGNTKHIIDHYLNGSYSEDNKSRTGTGTVKFKSIQFYNNEKTKSIKPNEKFTIKIELNNNSDNNLNEFRIGLSFHNYNGQLLSVNYSNYSDKWYKINDSIVTINDASLPLMPGNYFVRGLIISKDNEIYDWPDFNLFEFTILKGLIKLDGDPIQNPILLDLKWE